MTVQAPERPSQELLDGLSLDAAWERAQMLEAELRQARAMAKQNYESVLRASEQRARLEDGIRRIMDEYPVTGGLQDDLLGLLLGD